jgi:hypothetical protein
MILCKNTKEIIEKTHFQFVCNQLIKWFLKFNILSYFSKNSYWFHTGEQNKTFRRRKLVVINIYTLYVKMDKEMEILGAKWAYSSLICIALVVKLIKTIIIYVLTLSLH